MSIKPKPTFDFNTALGTDVETIQILDVGAMLEGEACYASLLEKGLAEVIGFEPNPDEFAALDNQELGPWRSRHFLPFAISAEGGRQTLFVPADPNCAICINILS